MDASFDINCVLGVRVLLSDMQMVLSLRLMQQYPFVEDAATAEARGLKDGLILANNVGYNKLEIEADCLEVIEIMNSGGNSLGPAASIYEECYFICRNFISISFHH